MTRTLATIPVLLIALSGCSLFRHPPEGGSRNRAFIQYRPSAAESGKTRLAIKDIVDVRGYVTTCGSEYLYKNGVPAKRNAACLEHVPWRNVAFVGKTNTTEFAVAVSGINEFFGTPRNPASRHGRRIPGGSSCGSAVAVATGMADVALGTDTAGSIRIPAACCGVYGLKTTFGLIPLEGVHPISPDHLDTVGPLARDIPHLVLGMEYLTPGFAGRYRERIAANPRGSSLRVGRLYLPGTDARVEHAVDDALRAAGFQVVPMPDSFRKAWLRAQTDNTTIAATGAWMSDREYARKAGVTGQTRAAVLVGNATFPAAYEASLERQRTWQQTLRGTFKSVDLIALPTLEGLPPRIPLFAGAPFEARVLRMQNTGAVNLGGVPAIAVPVPFPDRDVPWTSLQLIGPRHGEADLVNAARIVEAATRRKLPGQGQTTKLARN